MRTYMVSGASTMVFGSHRVAPGETINLDLAPEQEALYIAGGHLTPVEIPLPLFATPPDVDEPAADVTVLRGRSRRGKE